MQPVVRTAAGEQLGVGPAFDDAPAIEHENLICVHDRRKPVSDDEHCAALKQAIDGFLNEALALGVESRRGLIEYQHGRIHQQRASDRDPLPLAAAQTSAAFAEYRVVAVRQLANECVGIGGSRRRFDFLLRVTLATSVGDVAAYGVVEEHRLLTDDARQAAQRLQIDLAGIDTVESDPSGRRFIESRNQVHQRALPRTAGADQCHYLPVSRHEVDVLQHRLVAVSEVYSLEHDRLTKSLHHTGPSVGSRLGGRIEHLEHALSRGECVLSGGRDLGYLLERLQQSEYEREEGQELRGLQRSVDQHQPCADEQQEHRHRRADDFGYRLAQQRDLGHAHQPGGKAVAGGYESLPLVPFGSVRLDQSNAAHVLLQNTHHFAVLVTQPAVTAAEARKQRIECDQQHRHDDERDQRQASGNAGEIEDVDHDQRQVLERLSDDLSDQRLGLLCIAQHAGDDLPRFHAGEPSDR